MMERVVLRPLKVYGVAMAQYRDNDKLLVQTFPRSLTRATVAWFLKLNFRDQAVDQPRSPNSLRSIRPILTFLSIDNICSI